MRGKIIFSTRYLAWFSIWGPCETLITGRSSKNENDALLHAMYSIGIHWRPAPTEDPWSIGHSERHHGPIRDALTQIQAETEALAPDLALAIACKARNDAPRAHGVAPPAAVTGDLPRLPIGDNHHADPTIAGRHAAMQTDRATIERYKAADRLHDAPSLPDTNVPFVSVYQELRFHRHCLGWLRGRVHTVDGKTVNIQRDGKLVSSHESRTKLYVSGTPPPLPPPAAAPPRPAHAPASPTVPIRTHTPAGAPPSATRARPPSTRLVALDALAAGAGACVSFGPLRTSEAFAWMSFSSLALVVML